MKTIRNFLVNSGWKTKIALGTIMSWFLSIVNSTIVYAAGSINSAPQLSISTVGGIFCIINAGFDVMFWLLIALASVMIIVAAYNYVTAGGESEKVGKATKIITYAAIAVAVALLARGIPLIVGSFFGVTGLESSGVSC